MDAALAGFGSVVTLKRRLEMIGRAHVMWRQRSVRLFTAVVGLGMILAMIGHAAMAATLGPAAVFHAQGAAEHDSTGIDLHLRVNSDGTTQQAQIHALPQGRGPHDVLNRYSFVRGPSDGARFNEGSWLTDQETIVSAHDAHVWDGILEADEFLLNLPEGSNLQAMLEGESISLAMEGAKTLMVIAGGEIRLVDATGVARAVASAADSDSALEAVLLLEVSVENDEIVFRTRAEADGEPIPVRVVLDLTTGIPEDEEQPPHGAIRYWLRPSEHEDDPIRLKMQWIYDLSRLQDEVENEPLGERESRANQLMEQGRLVEALAQLQGTNQTLTDAWGVDRLVADYHAALGSDNKDLEALTRALEAASDRPNTQIEHLAQTALGCASCHWVADANHLSNQSALGSYINEVVALTRARLGAADSPNTQLDLAKRLLNLGLANEAATIREQAARLGRDASVALSAYENLKTILEQAGQREQVGDFINALQAYQRALLLGDEARAALNRIAIERDQEKANQLR